MGLLRLILAISVVGVHSAPILGINLVGGTVAVQAFYIISGFYMALILNEKYVGLDSYGLFLSNRFLRLYPTYFAILGLTLGLAAARWVHLGRWTGALGAFEMAQGMSWLTLGGLIFSNLFIFGQDVLMFLSFRPTEASVMFAPDLTTAAEPLWKFLLVPQAWTIAVELMFYMVAPLLVRRSIGLLLGIIAASLLARGLTYAAGYNSDPWTYRFIPFEMAFFLAGAVGYRILRKFKTSTAEVTGGKLACGTLILVTVFFAWIPLSYSIKQWLFYAVFACAVPLVFQAFNANRWDRWIGELSYPVYMSHMLVISVVGYSSNGPRIPENYLGVVACVGSIGMAMVLTKLVVEPMEKLRQARVRSRSLGGMPSLKRRGSLRMS